MLRMNLKCGKKEGKIHGYCKYFTLSDIPGCFLVSNIHERIHPGDVEELSCIQNTNLQCFRRHQKGHAVMVFTGEHEWRLCFVWSLSEKKIQLLKWKGKMHSQHSHPLFLYKTSDELIDTTDEEFEYLEYSSPPSPCYFVNIIPPYCHPPTELLMNAKKWVNVNAIDGKIDQYPCGPTQVWIPKPSIFKQDPPPSGIPKKRKNCFSKVPKFLKQREDHTEYDLIFVEYVQPGSLLPSKTSTFPLTFGEGNTKQGTLPKNFALKQFGDFLVRDNDIPNGLDVSEFHRYTQENGTFHSTSQRLCCENTNCRILVVHPDEFEELKNDNCLQLVEWGAKYRALIGTTDENPMLLPGVNISSWNTNLEVQEANGLSYEDLLGMYNIYKGGSGTRSRCENGGVCLFLGQRSTDQARQAPNSGFGETGKQQYWCQEWSENGSEMQRALFEKQIFQLPTRDQMLDLAYNYSKFVGMEDRYRSLVTFGVVNKLFSFHNDKHVDACDSIDESDTYLWMDELSRLATPSRLHGSRTQIIEKIRETCDVLGHVPVPTFCGYSYQWGTEEDKQDTVKVLQYFDYPELGIAKRIHMGSSHWMLASAFFHCTTVCVLIKNNKIFWKWIKDETPEFNLFAWGTLSKAEKRRRAQALNDRQRQERAEERAALIGRVQEEQRQWAQDQQEGVLYVNNTREFAEDESIEGGEVIHQFAGMVPVVDEVLEAPVHGEHVLDVDVGEEVHEYNSR